MRPASRLAQDVADLMAARAELVEDLAGEQPHPPALRRPPQDVPEQLEVRVILHGRKSRGGYICIYRNDEFAISRIIERETRQHCEQEIFTSDYLPGEEASSWPELRAAMRALPRRVQ